MRLGSLKRRGKREGKKEREGDGENLFSIK
jgi:hypothetical protein